MDIFGCTTIQIQNLNPEVALHSMLLALRLNKFADSLCKKPPGSMDELRKRAKDYIQMEEMSRFMNEVRQAGHKHDKRDGITKMDLHMLDKRHKPDKRLPLSKGLRYKCYAPLTVNHTTISEEAFNLEVPIWLSPRKPPRPGSEAIKYCRYHRNIGHNTEDYWALKDKIKELIRVRYLAQFVKRPNNHQVGARPGGH